MPLQIAGCVREARRPRGRAPRPKCGCGSWTAPCSAAQRPSWKSRAGSGGPGRSGRSAGCRAPCGSCVPRTTGSRVIAAVPNGSCRSRRPSLDARAGVLPLIVLPAHGAPAPVVAAAVGVHVDDGGRALCRMQVADVPRRAPSTVQPPAACGRSRISSPGRAWTPRRSCRGGQRDAGRADRNGSSPHSRPLFGAALIGIVARRVARASHARRLAGHDRRDLRAPLRHVPSAVAGLAPSRRQRDAGDAQSVAIDIARGVLGPAMEHGVS